MVLLCVNTRQSNPFALADGGQFTLVLGGQFDWIFHAIQAKYNSNEQKDIAIKMALDNEIVSKYGTKISFSLGTLNGKGWYFNNEKQYSKAIQAWKVLLESYPNFSEAYLYIAKAQAQLKQNNSEAVREFKKSLLNSEFYSEKEKKELLKELQEMK